MLRTTLKATLLALCAGIPVALGLVLTPPVLPADVERDGSSIEAAGRSASHAAQEPALPSQCLRPATNSAELRHPYQASGVAPAKRHRMLPSRTGWVETEQPEALSCRSMRVMLGRAPPGNLS